MITTEMNNMVGPAMLEAMWETKRKDLIDLVSPLVLYSIAKTTSLGNAVNGREVVNAMRHFGYDDIPVAIIESVCKREKKKYFHRNKGEYYLNAPLDDVVVGIDKREIECSERIRAFSADLAAYLSEHCKGYNTYSEERTISAINRFFERNVLYVGLNKIEEKLIKPKDNEEEYYIAKYILEKKNDSSSREYKYILELAKGYFLMNALYLQAKNTNICSSNYKSVDFFYDTPFLLNLLGCQSEEGESEALALHKAIIEQKGKCYYYPHVLSELHHILTAYQHSLTKPTLSTHTLEGLNRKNYTSDSVDRYKKNLEAKLATLGIRERDTVPLITKEDGTVDIKYVSDDEEIKAFIKDRIPKYKTENLENDISAVMSIHRQRHGKPCIDIEKCVAIFVTTNVDFIDSFNEYYSSKINAESFPIAISPTVLSAITWVKGGNIADLPETQLLSNAYSVMQPSEDVLICFERILGQMVENEKISIEEALVLCTDHVVQKELARNEATSHVEIGENFVLNAKQMIKEQYTREMYDSSRKEEELKEQKRMENVIRKAQIYAIKKKEKRISILKAFVGIGAGLLLISGIVGFVRTLDTTPNFFVVVFVIISVISIIDVFAARKGFVTKLIYKNAHAYETKCFEDKKIEYEQLFE